MALRLVLGIIVVAVGIWLALDGEQNLSFLARVMVPFLQRRPRRLLAQEHVDPTWQGVSLKRFENPKLPVSSVHCIGENFNQSTSWEYRSCEFTNLCYDTERGNFVVIRSATEAKLQDMLFYAQKKSTNQWQSTVTLSTLLSVEHSAVSLRVLLGYEPVIEADTTTSTIRWFPAVLDEQEAQQRYRDGYYQFSNHLTWIPWQPVADPTRHWLWTNWWPLFVLESLFPSRKGNEASPPRLLPFVPPSTSLNPSQESILQEFESYWGRPLRQDKKNDRAPRGLICAHRAVAGLGRLSPRLGETDSIGHGPALHAFANHVRSTLGVKSNSDKNRTIRLLASSETLNGYMHQEMQKALPDLQDVSKLDLVSQAEEMTHATTLIMTLSQECWAPLLLPDQALVIVLYGANEAVDFTDCVYVLNNAAYLHVEWVEMSQRAANVPPMKRIANLVATTTK